MTRRMPLGVDIGSSRVCVALAERASGGRARLRAVATQPIDAGTDPEFAAACAIRSAVTSLGTRERRCVVALSAPDAGVSLRRFPKMRATERARAIRFEVENDARWRSDDGPPVCRIQQLGPREERLALGIARASAVARACRLAGASGLRIVGIDLDAFALRRALPGACIVVDVGLHRTTVHAMWPVETSAAYLPAGGAAITRSIARDLDLDEDAAEKRKRLLGACGSAAAARRELLDGILTAVARVRRDASAVTLALVGNGSRLAGLRHEIERETGSLDYPVPPTFDGDAYPEDVVAAAVPDWALAVGLASWAAGQ